MAGRKGSPAISKDPTTGTILFEEDGWELWGYHNEPYGETIIWHRCRPHRKDYTRYVNSEPLKERCTGCLKAPPAALVGLKRLQDWVR